MSRWRGMIDDPVMSDQTIIITVEDLISATFGTIKRNTVDFKLMQTVLHILARQMRMLGQAVELNLSPVMFGDYDYGSPTQQKVKKKKRTKKYKICKCGGRNCKCNKRRKKRHAKKGKKGDKTVDDTEGNTTDGTEYKTADDTEDKTKKKDVKKDKKGDAKKDEKRVKIVDDTEDETIKKEVKKDKKRVKIVNDTKDDTGGKTADYTEDKTYKRDVKKDKKWDLRKHKRGNEIVDETEDITTDDTGGKTADYTEDETKKRYVRKDKKGDAKKDEGDNTVNDTEDNITDDTGGKPLDYTEDETKKRDVKKDKKGDAKKDEGDNTVNDTEDNITDDTGGKPLDYTEDETKKRDVKKDEKRDVKKHKRGDETVGDTEDNTTDDTRYETTNYTEDETKKSYVRKDKKEDVKKHKSGDKTVDNTEDSTTDDTGSKTADDTEYETESETEDEDHTRDIRRRSIVITEKEGPSKDSTATRDKILVAETAPISKHTERPRVGSIDVVTGSEFDLLAKRVQYLQQLAVPPTPALPDNQQLREDLAKGTATLPAAMKALQLTARVEAAESAVVRMVGLLTQLTSSGVIPPDMAATVTGLQAEVRAAMKARQDLAAQRGVRRMTCVADDLYDDNEGGLKQVYGTDSEDLGPSFPVTPTHFTRGTTAASNFVTEMAVRNSLRSLQEDVMKRGREMSGKVMEIADTAAATAKEVAKKLAVAETLDQRVTELGTMANNYAERLEGIDSGIKHQVSGLKLQVDITRADHQTALKQLANAADHESVALQNLKYRYSDLLAEMESTRNKLYLLSEIKRKIDADFAKLQESLENLRDQKADLEELRDALQDKADIACLEGLINDEIFEITKSELQKRLSMCYHKFNKQDRRWRQATKDILNIITVKANYSQLMSVKDAATVELYKLSGKLDELYLLLGDPKTALLTRQVSKNGTCGPCRIRALMSPEDPLSNVPPLLPALRAKPAEEPCTVSVVNFDSPPKRENKAHICRRYVGGSHTLLNVTRERARPLRLPPLSTRKYCGKGVDGKLYMMEDICKPCVECNDPAYRRDLAAGDSGVCHQVGDIGVKNGPLYDASGDNAAGDKMVGDKIAGVNIEGDKMAGDKMTGDNIEGDKMTGDNIEGDKMAGDKITGDNIEVDKMAGDKMTGDNIEGDKMTGDNIEGDKIAGDKIAGVNIEGDKMAGDKMTDDNIEGDKITGDNIEDDKMAGDKMTGDNIEGDKMAGDIITGDNIEDDKMPVENMVGDNAAGDETVGDDAVADEMADDTLAIKTGDTIDEGDEKKEDVTLDVENQDVNVSTDDNK